MVTIMGFRATGPNHNLSTHPLHIVWGNMMSRCHYSKDSYVNHAGRGIKVCDEWKNSYVSFYHWAILNGYKRKLQLDRIDNDGDYSPDNCRFTTSQINNINSRFKRGDNISGYRGVFIRKNGKHSAYASFLGERIYAGHTHLTAECAAIARDLLCISKNWSLPLNFHYTNPKLEMGWIHG